MSTQEEHDANAKWYLDNLQDGMKPDRPDVGRWLPLVELVEDTFDKGNGNRIQQVKLLLNSLVSANQFYGLAELLAGKPIPTKRYSITWNQQDRNARKVLLDLQAREKPPVSMPDCGHWHEVVQTVVRSYNEQDHTKPSDMPAFIINSLIGSQKWPELAELLSDEIPPDTSKSNGHKPVVQNDLSLVDSSSQSTMPVLTGEAVIPDSNILPRMGKEPKKWFEEWDSTGLREVSPWLADYISYGYKSSPEGHPDFHIAGALWALSTVAGRRIHAPLAKPMYTPLAIALVGRTSLFAKSVTAEPSYNVLEAAKLTWLLGDDETTPQKLLEDMSGHIPSNYSEMTFEQQMEIDKRLGMSGQVGWYYDEFNQLIDAMKRPGPMAEFAGLLRKLDNCRKVYTYSTKGGGKYRIEKPYLALLANTTPANLRKHASKGSEFWNDGFWARFAFITPPKHEWYTETMKMGVIPVPDMLADKLKDWNKRLGVPTCHVEEIPGENGKKTGKYKVVRGELPDHEITIEEEAYQAYVRYREALRKMLAEGENQDLDGSYTRIADKALRVATLLGSLENDNTIDFSIWALAQEIAEMFRRNLHEFYKQVSQTPDRPTYAKKIEDEILRVVRDLKARGKPAPTLKILHDYLKHKGFDVGRLKTATLDLVRADQLSEDRTGRSPRYSLVEETE